MPSTQSAAVRELYLDWTATRIRGAQPDDEAWSDLTTEPRAVDYTETEVNGLPAIWSAPKDAVSDRVLLGLHGGGFVGGSIYTHRKLHGHFAKAVGVHALSIGYRLAPAHQHPTQVNDVVSAYRWLLEQGIEAAHIALVGDSAGGGMCVTAQLRARELGLPLPAAALLLSPWVDMEVVGESYGTNWARDAFFCRELVQGLVQAWLGSYGDPRDPLANPLYADLTGLAPMRIQVGGDETLLADSRRLAELAEKSGVDVALEVFPDMQHTFQMAAGRAPEADTAIRALADWVRPRLGLTAREH